MLTRFGKYVKTLKAGMHSLYFIILIFKKKRRIYSNYFNKKKLLKCNNESNVCAEAVEIIDIKLRVTDLVK